MLLAKRSFSIFLVAVVAVFGKANRAGSARFARTSSVLENLRSFRTPVTELRSCSVRALPSLTELRSCSVRDARDARDVAHKNTILEASNVFCKLQKYQIEQTSQLCDLEGIF